MAGAGHPSHGQTHLVITVKHLSGPPTTITHVGFHVFKSKRYKAVATTAPLWMRRRFKLFPEHSGFTPASGTCRYPHKLEVGTEWVCTLEQSQFDELLKDGVLYLVLAHTLGRKEILEPVFFHAK